MEQLKALIVKAPELPVTRAAVDDERLFWGGYLLGGMGTFL